MEAALATVIIGVGVVSMLQLLAAGTVANSYSTEQATAVQLANGIHEIALGLPFFDPDTAAGATPLWSTPETGNTAFDDLLDLDGKSFTPPIDVRRQSMSQFSNWTQSIAVQSVPDDQLTSSSVNTVSEPTARVTVTIKHNNKQVYQMSWIAVAPNP